MTFRACGRRIAVDINSWNIQLPSPEVRGRLQRLGFVVREVSVAALACSFVGRSTYRRGASLSEAPGTFDCSSFVKWLYAERGIWLPRRCIHQYASLDRVKDDEILPGDLVFINGSVCPPIHLPVAHVSHVGIVTDDGLVVHATPDVNGGVTCDELSVWQKKKSWRGARRIIHPERSVLSLDIPSHLEIETSDDVCWHLLETFDWSN